MPVYHWKKGLAVQRLLFVWACMLISENACFAQGLNPDSLLQVIRGNGPDTFRIVAGKQLGQLYLDSNPAKSLSYFFPALDLAKKSGNWFQEGLLLQNIGVAYDINDELDSCLFYLNLASQFFKNRNMPEDQSHVINDIATAWYYRGNYELALRNYFEALELRRKSDNPGFISQSLNNLGVVYKSRKDYGNSIRYYKESLGIIPGAVEHVPVLVQSPDIQERIKNAGLVF